MGARLVSSDLLVEQACGQMDPALRAVVEAHLSLSPEARKRFSELCEAGGRFLEALPAVADGSLEAIWSRVEEHLAQERRDAPPIPLSVPLPEAVTAELPGIRRPLRWLRTGLRGARLAILERDPQREITLALAHMPGGRIFPRHRHLGFEHAVVLAGGYEDERGEFTAGDFIVYEPGSEHGPQTLDGEDCWILFRLEGRVRFRGWRGWLQRLLPAPGR